MELLLLFWLAPLHRVIDLDLEESAQVEYVTGRTARLTLRGISVRKDSLRDAIRDARVEVAVAGHRSVNLGCGNYNLPVTAGPVQVDCTVVRQYMENSNQDHWGLKKLARIRVWPAGSPWIEPGTFVYPVKQRWFAAATQMANEPTYVDGPEDPAQRKIYYHSGLDIGGAEGLVDVVAATDALVVSRGLDVMPAHKDGTPLQPRYDVVYLLDDRGWYYRYSHLFSIDAAARLGQRVRMGQKIGVLGKEGGSGGWSHLHFEIVARQPSGLWGTEEGYAFLWESYVRAHSPPIIAVARPHRFARVGETVTLDGSRSWSRTGAIRGYQWTFTDGTKASGAIVERRYSEPGTYSEILQVTDSAGAVAVDFAIVQVLSGGAGGPPSIHAAFAPSLGVRVGEPVEFLVRTFGTTHGNEQWKFESGANPVVVRSDGNVKQLAKDGYARTVHRFSKPGRHLVSVERANERGEKAVGRLEVVVDDRARR